MRWRATIRGYFFIHTAVTCLFDKTGVKGEYRVFIRKNTGNFTKWAPVTELPEFWRPSCMAHVKVLEKLFNLICRGPMGLFWCLSRPLLAIPLSLASFPPVRESLTAGCKGPVYALWVVLASQFDVRWKATPQGFFLCRGSSGLHFAPMGYRGPKSLARFSVRGCDVSGMARPFGPQSTVRRCYPFL